ncbi:MAG: hypothetical protein F6K19_20030 [Cyanothece sp. SIO1E1]|nr:hypothetical protein [Cyanothece sp. SIO1E1]
MFNQFCQYTFVYCQAHDLAGLIGRARSSSYVPSAGPSHQQMIADLQQLYANWVGERDFVELTYRTYLYLTHKIPGFKATREDRPEAESLE